jgi:hypothetical protein
MHRGVAFLIAVLAASRAAADPAVVPADPVPANPTPAIESVWIERWITFDYMGFTTAYTCDSLREKLIDLLRLAGARRDLEVTTSGCSFVSLNVSLLVHARMHFRSPRLPQSEANPSSLQVLPAMSHWAPVQISSDRPRSFSRGDCELIEQFEQQVLKNFEVRNIESDLRCVPHQLPSARMHLNFEALTGTKTSEDESIEIEKHRKKPDNEMKSDRKPTPAR